MEGELNLPGVKEINQDYRLAFRSQQASYIGRCEELSP
jgi:hypothetical protein